MTEIAKQALEMIAVGRPGYRALAGIDEKYAPDEEEEAVDFESILERQPQKSGMARRGSAMRNAVRGGFQGLRRVGSERIAESRDRVHALRERVPTRVPEPRPADGAGKPPPPHLPRRISSRRPRKPDPGRIKKLRLLILIVGLGLLAIVSTFFGMMMAISQDLPQLENKKEFAEAKNSVVVDDQGNTIGALLNNDKPNLVESGDISPYMKGTSLRTSGAAPTPPKPLRLIHGTPLGPPPSRRDSSRGLPSDAAYR